MTESRSPVIVRQLGRDFIKSVGGLVSNIVLLTILVEFGQIPPQMAAIISVAVLLVAAYVVTDTWVFVSEASSNRTEHGIRFGGYVVVYWLGMALKYGLYLLLLPHVAYQVAWAIGAGLVFFVTFLANRWLWLNASR